MSPHLFGVEWKMMMIMMMMTALIEEAVKDTVETGGDHGGLPFSPSSRQEKKKVLLLPLVFPLFLFFPYFPFFCISFLLSYFPFFPIFFPFSGKTFCLVKQGGKWTCLAAAACKERVCDSVVWPSLRLKRGLMSTRQGQLW